MRQSAFKAIPQLSISAFVTQVLLMSLFLFGCSGKAPTNLGVHEGKLASCPDSPNCVSSQSSSETHAIAALSYSASTSGSQAFSLLKEVIRKTENTQVIQETERYFYVEFMSQWMHFVDDVEFLLDAEKKHIHVRSASRLGYSDLGVNRKRIETIRKKFEEKLN